MWRGPPSLHFSGTFNATNIPGLVISGPTVTYEIGNTGANANVRQRIRFEYEIQFTNASLAVFPSAGNAAKPFTLSAKIDIQGQAYPSLPAELFLLAGADPYFSNINAKAGNFPYLSQDLRVFTITPTANNQTPIGNVPFKFHAPGSPTVLDTAAAYSYIQNLITWLNNQYGYLNTTYLPPDTNISDPLDTKLPQQGGALKGDSSATPKTGSNNNYNFAIARVRLKSSSGIAVPGVKVFFRLFTTQTFDTDFINSASAVTSADPNVTYPPSGNNPSNPIREPTAAAPSMAARCHSLPQRITMTIPATTQQRGQTTKRSSFPAGMITPGRSMGVSSTSMTQRTNLAAIPSSIGWLAAPTTAWWRRSPINLRRSKTPTE